MVKFNSNHLVVGEIKQFLKDFNLPKIKVWKEGITIFNGIFYIKDGFLQIGRGGALHKVNPYTYGQSVKHITHNLIINNNIYDEYVHTYLGNYLRFYRDFHNIDLMSMYNCFSNESPPSLTVKTDNFSFDTTNVKYKIYMVPIKWYQDYTIGLESSTQVELMVGLYNNGRTISYSSAGGDIELYNTTYQKVSGMRVNKPILYTKAKEFSENTLNKYLYNQESNLKLFIKVPSNARTSVTVLEGDFRKSGELHFEKDDKFATRRPLKTVINYERGTGDGGNFKYKGYAFEREYVSYPQLLKYNTVSSYPMADRLVEYLFNGVITPTDEIVDNTTRVQQRLVQRFNTKVDVNGERVHKYVGIPYIISNVGDWSTHLRNVVYDVAMTSNIRGTVGTNKYDLIGFVDKDVERVLGEYQERGDKR